MVTLGLKFCEYRVPILRNNNSILKAKGCFDTESDVSPQGTHCEVSKFQKLTIKKMGFSYPSICNLFKIPVCKYSAIPEVTRGLSCVSFK